MACPVHDKQDGSGNNVYPYDPDYLTSGVCSLALCMQIIGDSNTYHYYSEKLYLEGEYQKTITGYIPTNYHDVHTFNYSVGDLYKKLGYGIHYFYFDGAVPFTIQQQRVFLFENGDMEADEYDPWSMNGVTLTTDGFEKLIVKAEGKVENLTIADSNDKLTLAATFHKDAIAQNVTVGKKSVLAMNEGSKLSGDISVTGQVAVGGKIDAKAANITLNVKDHSPEDEYMISGASSLADASSCTISVKSDQADGEYFIASGFINSVKNTVWEKISLTVDGISPVEEYAGQYTFAWNDKTVSYNAIRYDDTIYSLNFAFPIPGTLTLTVEDAEIPDQVLELLARNKEYYSVYETQEEGDILTVEYDDKKYYFLVSCVVEDNTGFDAMGLIRVTSNDPENFKSLGQSVVVCRGSEDEMENLRDGEGEGWIGIGGDYLDWKDDFNPAGVGVAQFNGIAAAQLKLWLIKERTQDEVYFTGHSLGGALAQRFSVYYNAIPGSNIGGLVTFNAPGVDENVSIDANKVHHYIVDGDMISMVGNGFVTGDSESDSWYTICFDNNVYEGDVWKSNTESNPAGYLVNRHTATWTCDGKKMSPKSDIAELADKNFSYIGDPENCNVNYMRFVLSLAQRYVKASPQSVLCSNYYKDNNDEYLFDINVANNLTTREKTENFRRECDYNDFLKTILIPKDGSWYEYLPSKLEKLDTPFSNEPDFMSTIKVGTKKLISSNGKNSEHDIRTLQFTGEYNDDLPDLLYDFTAQEFITIKYVDLEDDYLFTWNDHDNNINYVREVSVKKNENTWICFSLPYSYNNFLELKSIMTESGQVVSTGNYILTGNKIIVLDDPSTTYIFSFQRDESITQTTAQIYVSEENISIVTEAIQLELSDIDASLTAGGSNDVIWVDVVSDSMPEAVRIELTETAFEGVFTGSFTLKEKDGNTPDVTISCYDNLTISYNDGKNKDGNAEVITATCKVEPVVLDVMLGSTGLPEEYSGEFKSLEGFELDVNISQISQTGEYVLIQNPGDFIPVVNLKDFITDTSVKVQAGEDYYIDGRKYQLYVKDNNFMISVERSHRIISWDSFSDNDTYCIEFSKDDFATAYSYTVYTNEIQLFNLPVGGYKYRVRAADGDKWQVEGSMAVIVPQVGNSWISDSDDVQDMFFAAPSGVWDGMYVARHYGIVDGWTGTNEQVYLAGKNKFKDIFAGSDDANVLILTDDANGDALFVDDIYTALPGDVTEMQTRFSQIDEIHAGAGNDVVDLTSQRFNCDNDHMVVYGGLGDDTVWANTGTNVIFGGAGNDRLIGGDMDDIIIGGIGNDSMHGGGGDDVFCFGADWGNDTVKQLKGGTVTLWLKRGSMQNWDQSTLTYTDGANKITVSGVSVNDVTLKFGDDMSNLYDELVFAGCFENSVSEKIFDDKDKGILA